MTCADGTVEEPARGAGGDLSMATGAAPPGLTMPAPDLAPRHPERHPRPDRTRFRTARR
ncbi:hypothetical protein AB0H34_43365 [Saccharopolyspora shandongensis]|uniref:hypothetical protein n=1 Tax=Saccharopolyspora shandongensis TaxID=418495 RepID=UPI00340239BC